MHSLDQFLFFEWRTPQARPVHFTTFCLFTDISADSIAVIDDNDVRSGVLKTPILLFGQANWFMPEICANDPTFK